MAATLTIGLVIEAMRKMVSLVIGALASLSRKPKESNITSLPLRAISTTAPGSSLFFTPSSMRSDSRFRRLATKPTSSGDCALGMPWAPAGNAIETASAAAAARRTIDIVFPPEPGPSKQNASACARVLASHSEKALDQPDRADQRHDHRQDLRQARQAAGARRPDERRHDDGDEGELAQLDADIEADQRPHQGVPRQAELGERRGEAQAMDQAEEAAISQRRPAPAGATRFSTATQTIEAAISGSTIDDGTSTMPSAARLKVMLWATVKAVTIFTVCQKARGEREQGQQEQQMVDAADDVLDAEAEIGNELCLPPGAQAQRSPVMAMLAWRWPFSNTTCLAPPGHWMSAIV